MVTLPVDDDQINPENSEQRKERRGLRGRDRKTEATLEKGVRDYIKTAIRVV